MNVPSTGSDTDSSCDRSDAKPQSGDGRDRKDGAATPGIDRRTVIKIGAAGAALAGVRGMSTATASAAPASKDKAGDAGELRNGEGRFRVEIDGVALTQIEGVATEPLRFDVRERPAGVDWDYREFDPGDGHYGSITLRTYPGPDADALKAWFDEAARGADIRKQISVIVLKRDGSESRRWNAHDCFPTSWDPGEYSPSSNVAVETITCKMSRVELA